MRAIRHRALLRLHLVAFTSLLVTILPSELSAGDRSKEIEAKLERMGRSLAVQGEFVHNVGQLQMNVTNWGFFGSLPGSQLPMSESPSAQFPAGSGVEYLYAAGLWVGALKNGVPVVSTGYPETEFYPPQGDIHTVYRTWEGAPGGSHFPENPDDDFDGLLDEDWLNGMDDDGDGLVDEDFAAFGTQMFSCYFTDDQPMAVSIWPEHEPMHLQVRQESFQWAEKGYDKFIGVRYFLRYEGTDYLDQMIVGIYADLDAGPRTRGTYHRDDRVGFFRDVVCAPFGIEEKPVHVMVGYVYDDDGDNGKTPGYFGIALIDYYTHYLIPKYNIPAPRKPGRLSKWPANFRIFRSLMPFEKGGEPTNDFERYKVLSTPWQYDTTYEPGDYKALFSINYFYLLPYIDTAEISIAYVAGFGLEDMLQSAARAAVHYDGLWVNKDGDPKSGTDARETPLYGPADEVLPDPCKYPTLKVEVPAGEICWVNFDCWREKFEREYTRCYHPPNSPYERFMTGINGKEHQVFWVASSAPPPPNIRCVPGDRSVTVIWDNFSETVPDMVSQKYDFEGYQIHRAHNWHRPIGTSIESGPTPELWRLLETRDLVNGVKPDTDFKKPYSQGGWIYEPMPDLEGRDQLIAMFEESILYAPLDTVPCPPGLENEQCDTLEAIARYHLGFEGGRTFYRYVDTDVKNGMPYFYAVTPYDHTLDGDRPVSTGRYAQPTARFIYVEPVSDAQEAEEFDEREIYVVPNPVSRDRMEPWRLEPNDDDPSGLKCEFRNLPACRSTVRIFTVAGDLVQTLVNDGRDGGGSLAWDLLTRNGQDATSGIYLFSVEPEDARFERAVGKFIVIR